MVAYAKEAPTLLEEKGNGKAHFNMWLANQVDLQSAGVHHIEVSGICTACNTGDWFSHRAEKGRTGRFGVLMALGKTGRS